MRILITGGTSGIGRAVAVLLGQHGAHVDVIGGINEARGAALTAEFQDLEGTMCFFPADLSSLESINDVLDEYLSQSETLDAAFLNAGVFHREATVDAKGRDTAFMVNYLHRFIFVRRLNELLRSSAEPRILINGSSNRALGLDLDPQVFGRRYSGTKGLTHALAANGFLTYWLNRRFATGVPVQSIDPGYVNTKMVEGGASRCAFYRVGSLSNLKRRPRRLYRCLRAKTFRGRTASSIAAPNRWVSNGGLQIIRKGSIRSGNSASN